MKHIAFTAAATTIVLACAFVSNAAESACLEYEPAIVSMTGKVTTHLEYGSPGFGEDPAHDTKENYWYLDLDKPICTNGKDEDSPDMEGEVNIKRLQIVFLDGYPKKRWVGLRAAITGRLFHAETGHHHTRVLILPESITEDSAHRAP